MGWQDLLTKATELILPWLGGRKVYGPSQTTYEIEGKLPREFGWVTFEITGRKAKVLRPATGPDDSYETGLKLTRGYLAGSRFIADSASIVCDPDRLVDQTENVYLVERGLERFTRAVVARTIDDKLIYLRQEFPSGPEGEVQAAYQDRKDSVAHVKGVTPALDLAFRWESLQRLREEEREREEERRRVETLAKAEAEAQLREAMKNAGTGAGRRELAKRDFKAAAKAALAVSGAELLDSRPGRHAAEMVVQYKFMERRLECVCDRDTLRILDAGVCLDDHKGTKGDTFFTLESLPAVIGEAIRERKLVVWRHVNGDPGARYDEPEWDEDD